MTESEVRKHWVIRCYYCETKLKLMQSYRELRVYDPIVSTANVCVPCSSLLKDLPVEWLSGWNRYALKE